jgi:hypothetical protein
VWFFIEHKYAFTLIILCLVGTINKIISHENNFINKNDITYMSGVKMPKKVNLKIIPLEEPEEEVDIEKEIFDINELGATGHELIIDERVDDKKGGKFRLRCTVDRFDARDIGNEIQVSAKVHRPLWDDEFHDLAEDWLKEAVECGIMTSYPRISVNLYYQDDHCKKCGGEGVIDGKKCKLCKGEGYIIPPFVPDPNFNFDEK